MSILIKLLTGCSKCISCNSCYCHCLLAVFKHDFYLTLLYLKFAEVSDHFSHSQPPITGTTKAPGTSTALLESTRPALAEDHGDSNRWSLCTLLVFVVAHWSNCSCVWNMNSFFIFVLCSSSESPGVLVCRWLSLWQLQWWCSSVQWLVLFAAESGENPNC